MKNNFEIEGINYVAFLNRGLKFDRRTSRPNKSELISFIKTESGEKIIHSESLENQLIKIKERIGYSIELLLRNYIFEDDKKKEFLNLIDDLKDSTKSSEIITIIEKGLILTDKFK
jgi:hypothetical protein